MERKEEFIYALTFDNDKGREGVFQDISKITFLKYRLILLIILGTKKS